MRCPTAVLVKERAEVLKEPGELTFDTLAVEMNTSSFSVHQHENASSFNTAAPNQLMCRNDSYLGGEKCRQQVQYLAMQWSEKKTLAF